MLRKLRSSTRAVSEVLAVIIILSLVIAASVIVGVVILNVDVIELPNYFEQPTTKKVLLTLSVESYNDTDADLNYDELVIFISLDVNSPTVYIKDVDLLLPTGQTLDEITPWTIGYSSQIWNSEFEGFAVPFGTINSSFILQIDNLNQNNAEVKTGESLYIILRYLYVSQSGPRLDLVSSTFQSPLFTFS